MKITKISETEELVEIGSFAIKRNIDGICTQCRINHTTTVNLGQKVYSNGRFGATGGTMVWLLEFIFLAKVGLQTSSMCGSKVNTTHSI